MGEKDFKNTGLWDLCGNEEKYLGGWARDEPLLFFPTALQISFPYRFSVIVLIPVLGRSGG